MGKIGLSLEFSKPRKTVRFAHYGAGLLVLLFSGSAAAKDYAVVPGTDGSCGYTYELRVADGEEIESFEMLRSSSEALDLMELDLPSDDTSIAKSASRTSSTSSAVPGIAPAGTAACDAAKAAYQAADAAYQAAQKALSPLKAAWRDAAKKLSDCRRKRCLGGPPCDVEQEDYDAALAEYAAGMANFNAVREVFIQAVRDLTAACGQ